jgi:hypothetical protein
MCMCFGHAEGDDFVCLLLLKGKVHLYCSYGLVTCDTVEKSLSCYRISQNDTFSSTCSS